MWNSPINAMYHGVELSLEDAVFKAIQKVDIEVDREELIKALQYDRNQYEKGYADGIKDAEKTGKWMNNQNGTFTCSICGCKHSRSTFCPNCGARMEI